MPKDDSVEMDGRVIEAMRGAQYKVRLDNGHEMLAYTGGKMPKFRIRIILGDRVRVEMSPYDRTRGRVSYRYRYGAAPEQGAAWEDRAGGTLPAETGVLARV
jgi:translation initiation factor IF-1